jgi:uncharacterized phage protein (TIGR02218 family)
MRAFPFDQDTVEGLPYLITITRGTETIRFTTYHTAITVDGDTWTPGPGAMVTNMQFPSDGSPSTCDVNIFADTGGTIDRGEAARGEFDGWPISVAVTDGTSGATEMFPNATIGNVIEDTKGIVVFSVNGALNRSRQQVTEHYALMCRADLYDSRCKVVRADYTVSVTGEAIGPYDIQLDSMPDGRASDATWFLMGLVAFTSGTLSGYPDYQIRDWNPSTQRVALFLPVAVEDVPAATTMDISAGCDLTREQCFSRFNNIVNMRAETFVPPSNIINTFGQVGQAEAVP